jgi:hypothetical protein
MEELVAIIQKQQQQIESLQGTVAKNKGSYRDLSDEVRGAIAPHLQITPLEDFERKRMLSAYDKIQDGPKALKDDNGLATKAMGQSTAKKWLTKDLPLLQKEQLDVLRVAATTWDKCIQLDKMGQAEHAYKQAMQALRDITLLSSDNACRMGRYQLQNVLEQANVKGAYGMLQLGSDSAADGSGLDVSDHNIIQHLHVEAIKELRQFSRDIEGNKAKQQPKNFQSRGWRGRGNGGRGSGAWRGRGNNWRGRGGRSAAPESYRKQEQKQE